MKRVSNVINLGWRRRVGAAALALAATLVFFVASALGDAGNPILGTIHGQIESTPKPGFPNAVTVYVRGQWNWLSHNSDCNFDRAATGVGIIWSDLNGTGTSAGTNEVQRVSLVGTVTGGTFTLKFNAQTTAAIAYNADAATMDARLEALSTVGSGNVSVSKPTGTQWDVTFTGTLGKQDVPAIQVGNKSLTGSGTNVSITTLTPGAAPVYNGFLVANGGIQGYVGTKTATSLNGIDQMVHPVDLGNQIEGYTTAGTDYPTGQQYVDPTPPQANGGAITAAEVSAWKGGCGREPITATASKATQPIPGQDKEPTGLSCGNGTTTCASHPWGSWGYQQNGGKGYAHVFRSRADVTTICANFYDVHGGGTLTSGKFQLVNGTKEIDVDGNGDNSIDTNAFNTAQGANCISFGVAQPNIITHASDPITIGEGSLSDTATLSNGSSPTGTITFNLYPPNDPTCAGAAVFTSTVPVNNGNADYQSGTFSPNGTSPQTAGTYQWVASYSGDGANASATTACGDPNEQGIVNRHPSSVPTGQKLRVTDYAKVSPVSGTGTPTGTVRFQLFLEPSQNCTDTANRSYDSGPVPLTGGLANSAQQLLNVNGTYSWLVTYSGDTTFSASESRCIEQIATSGNEPGIDP